MQRMYLLMLAQCFQLQELERMEEELKHERLQYEQEKKKAEVDLLRKEYRLRQVSRPTYKLHSLVSDSDHHDIL